MKPFLHLALILLSINLCSCHKNDNTYKVAGEYLIVGRDGGLAIADSSANYYIIEAGQLRQDTSQFHGSLPANIGEFRFRRQLSAANYNAVAYLQSAIPSELLSHNQEHIGTQVSDSGYIDIRTSAHGTAYIWYFEQDQSKSSTAVQSFVASVKQHF